MITVRAAKPGDGVLLMQTTRQLADMHGMGHRFTATTERYEDALFASHPIIGALIAEDDGSFAGSVVWHRSFSTNSAREIIYLEDIVVLEPHRRKGVAKALMKELARFAIARDTYAIYWLMAGWNAEAAAFYESLGAEVLKDFMIWTVMDDKLKALAL
jgi:GNAT superfamily N-acetyltransferase